MTAGSFGVENLARWGAFASAGPADLFCDGMINGLDLAALLAAWGACPKRGDCLADLDGDSIVNGFDLALLLAEWG